MEETTEITCAFCGRELDEDEIFTLDITVNPRFTDALCGNNHF